MQPSVVKASDSYSACLLSWKSMLNCLLPWSVLALIPATAAFAPAIGHSSSNNIECQPNGIILHTADVNAATDIEINIDNNVPPANHQRNIIVLCHNVSQDIANGIFDVNNLPKGRIDVLARCVTSALWVSNGIRTDTTIFLMLFPHKITIEVQGSCVRSLTPDERTMALYLQRTLWNGKDEEDNSQGKGGQEDDASNNMSDSGSDSDSNNNGSQTKPHKTYINPRSAPMSEEKRLRDMRKGREAMIARIRSTHRGKSSLPGFTSHYDDTLQSRLNQLVSLSEDNRGNGDSSIWMLSETGDPLWDVLEERQQSKQHRATEMSDGDGQSRTVTTATTLILGNQMGYSVNDEKLLLGTPTVREVSLGSLSLLTSQCITITHHYLDRFDSTHG